LNGRLINPRGAILKTFDVIVIGGGAAGLMCAITAGNRGRSVLVLEHSNRIGKKILMSGGGRCNFTNRSVSPENYISTNSHFCKSALSRYTPWDFIELVERHGIPYHEKKAGQLFCDNKASDIVEMLFQECVGAGVEIKTKTRVGRISREERVCVETDIGRFYGESLVIATGGLSIPTMGATGFGYEVARQFGLNVLETRAALVPFTFNDNMRKQFADLSGISSEAEVLCNGKSFRENLLFTHRGISGPVILQASSYWRPGQPVEINLAPDRDIEGYLLDCKGQRPKAELKTCLSGFLSRRLAQKVCDLWCDSKAMNHYSDRALQEIAEKLQQWKPNPSGTEGYRTAEVTLGGLDTRELSSKTMESKRVSGLYFIGEVMDVTGQLGGYNFQWAWASGYAAGQYV